MQRSRRANPYPFTWEITLVAVMVVLFVLLLAVQVGRSVAVVLAGGGWVFVDRPHLVTSVGGILAGHASAGLDGLGRPVGSGLLWACVLCVEMVALAGCAVGLKVGLDRWGPARLQGMATRVEADQLLGLARLRRHAKVIRPDLYGAGGGGVR